MVLTVSFVVSLVIGLSCHHPRRDAGVSGPKGRHRHSIIGRLIPASRYQDATTSPSATRAFVSCAIASTASPAPRFVTIAKRPSGGQVTRGKLPVICPSSQVKRSAAHWHDGQISRVRQSRVKNGLRRLDCANRPEGCAIQTTIYPVNRSRCSVQGRPLAMPLIGRASNSTIV